MSTPNKLWFSPFYKSLNQEYIRELRVTDLIKILKSSSFYHYQLYVMGNKESFLSYIINVFKYILINIFSKTMLNIVDQFFSYYTKLQETVEIDPLPKYPILTTTNGFWRYEWFIIKVLKT